MLHITPYWRRYQKQILLALCALILGVVSDLLQPTIVSRIIDDGVMNGDLSTVFRLGGLMLAVTAFGAMCAIVRCVISSRVSQQFGADLRLDLFAKINRFSIAALGKKETAGLITRMTNDTSQLVNFTNSLMRVFVRAPALLIGAIVMTVLLNPRLALILIVVVPIIAILMYISLKVTLPMFAKMQAALDKNNSVIREYLSGVRVVKAYNTFDQEVERFDGTNTDLVAISTKAQRTVGVFFPIISFTVNMGLVVTLWAARGWIADSTMQVGQIVAFLNYMTQISMALRMIFMVYQNFIRAKASAERVAEILQEDDISSELGEVYAIPADFNNSIRFNNVSFTYPGGGDNPVLQDISFTLPAGETLGVLGSTGAGKTSLVQLIPGFYQPNSGEVFIGNNSTAELDPDVLRSAIAYVAQQNTIFYGTIADNIRMGKADATPQDLEEAAKAAGAYEFISAYPDGFDTIIGQKGVNISGGQKQRIGIARALVRKAPILILDDCVSAVDVETEANIMKSIWQISPAPTCIMITQRISSVMNLQHILVLENGQVAGFGNHDQLMESCKIYREMYAVK
ncbi:MAG: ABC transporter ATP-binding protein/permease [Firmicutes bacterium]|nr:ABC transporter ATP-binding protein/permease [Bacillota bacterium]